MKNPRSSEKRLVPGNWAQTSCTSFGDVTEILERINDCFFAVDHQFRFVYVNQRFEHLLGRKRRNILGHTLWECFPALLGTVYYNYYHQAMSESKPVSFERFVPMLNRWFEVNVHPSGTGLSVFFRDITDEKHTREALHLSNERFCLAAKTDAIYDWDLTTNHLYWGEGLREIFGYTTSEMQIHEWTAALHPEDRLHMVDDLNQALNDRAESVWKREYRLRGKEGVYCFVHERGHIVRNDEGKAIRMVGVMQNITERKHAEEELRKLSLVAKETVNAVFVTDTAHKIVWINYAFTKLFGYTKEEAIGKLASELLDSPEADADTLSKMRQKSFSRAGFHVEVLNRTKSGGSVWCESSYQPVFDTCGELIQHFCIITDITHRKTLEQKLERQRRRTTAAVIKAQERERTQIGRELHDNINQVLTTVKLYQDLIASGVGSRDELVKKSTALLQQSINDIRCLSKRLAAPTLGNIELRDSVSELLANVAATCQFELADDLEGIDKVDVSEELHLAVFRILQEQLTNILKYAEASYVTVRIAVEGENLVLKVSDNGNGFDPLQKRTGVGLTNIQMRTENVGGVMAIDSAPGKGCTLTAVFPMIR